MVNVTLRPRTIEHVKIFWEKSHDEEIVRLFPFERRTLEETIKQFEESQKPEARSFGQIIHVDDVYVGDVWCYGIDESHEKKAFISIVIFDKSFWGMGIGKNAMKQFCLLIFNRFAINKLCAFTFKSNKRSIGAMESVGFNRIEEFEEDGRISCFYEVSRSEIEASN